MENGHYRQRAAGERIIALRQDGVDLHEAPPRETQVPAQGFDVVLRQPHVSIALAAVAAAVAYELVELLAPGHGS